MRFGADQDADADETRLSSRRIGGALTVANALGSTSGGTSSYGVSGIGQVGVNGATERGYGTLGFSRLDGTFPTGVVGLGLGINNTGVIGEANKGGAAFGVWGKSTGGFAGVFHGKVDVYGALTKPAGGFKIDHPLDPENRYLVHSFVESPDMLNVYSGNVETDGNGEAVVTLPSYFDALNQDFTYQLTSIKNFTQAIVAEEIHENRFSIRTDKPNVKVSWQVTGVRKDPYAIQNRIAPEAEKPEAERGLFLYPEVYDQPRSRHIHFERERAHEAATETIKIQAKEIFEKYA
ncbi:hypothetical protein [Streptomyces hirsutus]|uniref:hypothetical protein n=1 Tax=Streptomyces hirsutus TaxID=35620 RepID=UPI00367393E7